MSRSISKTILVGNVGRDPEVQTTASGMRVANLSIATSRNVQTRDGQWEERTDWHRCVAWDKLAAIAEEYVRKGDRIYIEGRIVYDSYEKNGVTIPTAEIHIRELVLLGSPGRGGSADNAGDPGDAHYTRPAPTQAGGFTRQGR
jgi:single-strand DNA-binding protein